MISVKDLPTLNACLNLTSATLLYIGRIQIKRSQAEKHKKIMLAALVSSTLFLISYLVYHIMEGAILYSKYDWTRPVYFIILIPHVILAGLMVPFILLAVRYAFHGKFEKHKRIVKIIWPVWMFVSISGIVVYVMLYRL
jgi:putative membrane protein